MKRAIITGGTGMLGIALIKQLRKQGIDTTVIIRPGSTRAYRVPKEKNIHIIECSLNEIFSLKEKISGKYDWFFHFAWDGTFGEARNDMALQIQNIQATLNAVDLAKHLSCEMFLGAGSQAEFGKVDGAKKLSEDVLTKPENGYGIAKLCAGQMSRVVCSQYDIRHIWMRILSTYGPNDGMHTMVNSGIRQMLDHQRPQYTKGEQMWDYLYCDDAAEAFYLAAQHGQHGAIYCLGSGQVRPLADYIKDIRDVVSPGCDIGFGEIPYYDNQVMYLCADISKLTEDTGFVPKTAFKEGIQKTLEWMKEEVKHEKN